MIYRLQTERRDSFRVRDSHPIPLFSEQECVSDCSGRACATKAMVFSLLYARLILRTQKDLSCPAISQAKEVSYSLYIRFDCTQKLPFYLNRKGWLVGWLVAWLVGWLVARIVPIIYILVTIYHNCVHFLSKIYILILPQSGVIVKRKIFRGFGRIFGKDFSLLQPEQPVSRIYPANPVVMDFRVIVHSEKDFRIMIFDCTQRAEFSLKCLFITNR